MNGSCEQYRTRFCIAADHPCLAGHFPGRPIVPGVLLLDQVASALQNWRNLTIYRLPQVKFLYPLLPEQEAELSLEHYSDRLRFVIRHNKTTIASGEIGVME